MNGSRSSSGTETAHAHQFNVEERPAFASGARRNWALFAFFRVVKQVQHDAYLALLIEEIFRAKDASGDDKSTPPEEFPAGAGDTLGAIKSVLTSTAVHDAGLDDEIVRKAKLAAQGEGELEIQLSSDLPGEQFKSADRGSQASSNKYESLEHALRPCGAFFGWLGTAATGDQRRLYDALAEAYAKVSRLLAERRGEAPPPFPALPDGGLSELIREQLKRLMTSGPDAQSPLGARVQELLDAAGPEGKAALIELLVLLFVPDASSPDDIAAKRGAAALRSGLIGVVIYELARQLALTGTVAGKAGPFGEREFAALKGKAPPDGFDGAPFNLAFTHPGLAALQLDPRTLESFPDVFKEGMAARAEFLGDAGPSAPEYWEGVLGQRHVHGFFSLSFNADAARESDWKRLRGQIRAFNTGGEEGAALRAALGVLLQLIGLEIVHLELGQDPYRVNDDGALGQFPHRIEHFGFRDGISQPFKDLSLGAPAPGGGVYEGDGAWRPVAKGEIFLGEADEDGDRVLTPGNAQLRDGATFLVFRKLEQAVSGFRKFLEERRPHDPDAQNRLAAQMVGRWRNGASLVHAPTASPEKIPDEKKLNDFTYAGDDPDGRRCPLSAHIRRANPRDIASGAARRHRILRRGIAYGGAYIGPEDPDDGEPRGLLFIAANARIDLQFEVIQSKWINRGEFLGQAGLGRCPLTGANSAGPGDSFITADSLPVTRLPAFVRTRGGDYFFLPSLTALREIARGNKFQYEGEDHARSGFGALNTPVLFDTDRLWKDGQQILAPGGPRSISYTMPPARRRRSGPAAPQVFDDDPAPVSFVGRHDDVTRALTAPNQRATVRRYKSASRDMLNGRYIPLATESGCPLTGEHRRRMLSLLNEAWDTVDRNVGGIDRRIGEVVDRQLSIAHASKRNTGRIDLVQDLAARTAYEVARDVYGTPGPGYLSELAVSLPFSRRRIGQLYPDWLEAVSGEAPAAPGRVSMQLWAILTFAEMVTNVQDLQDLRDLARQAADELWAHLGQLITEARDFPTSAPATMLQALMAQQSRAMREFGISQTEFDDYVRLILIEVIGSLLAVVPSTFGSIMAGIFDFHIDLPALRRILIDRRRPPSGPRDAFTPSEATKLIYEILRVRSNIPLLLRYAAADFPLGDQTAVPAGNWIGALVGAAHFDGDVFTDPMKFSLSPFLPGPARPLDKYLIFGPHGSEKRCWGRERLAMPMLIRFVNKAADFPGLKGIAGPAGEPSELAEAVIGLKAQFAPH